MRSIIEETLRKSIEVKESVLRNETIISSIQTASNSITEALKNGGKVIICGNGGSASDALHFCGELVGRFQKERHALPAIALNADVATLTAVSNDYGYDRVFERGVQAYMRPKDVFVGISTSGNSINVMNAVRVANSIGGYTIGLLGKTGGTLKDEVSCPIVIPSDNTARIQESHICILHIIGDLVERTLFNE